MAAPKGHKRYGGRQKGVPNKFNADVKAMILQALNGAGGAAYLQRQADENPAAFMSLVGKVLPMQVTQETNANITITRIELVAQPLEHKPAIEAPYLVYERDHAPG